MVNPPCSSNPARFTTPAGTAEEELEITRICGDCPLRRECARIAVQSNPRPERDMTLRYGDVYAAGVWLPLSTSKNARYTALKRLRRIAGAEPEGAAA